MIDILKQCRREIENLPMEIREDLADAVARLTGLRRQLGETKKTNAEFMKRTPSKQLAHDLGIHPARSMEALLKAKLIAAVVRTTKKHGITHAELARRSGVPRSAVTGILSGSLQKVTIDRVLRLVDAVNLTAEIRIKEAA